MSKNLVICCDGTANEFAEDQTNVLKLFSTLVQDPSCQIAFYHPGIGTMEPPGALTPLRKRAAMGLEQAVGAGLENDIRDAYIYIIRNYEPNDRLYLFGFSRGAYTVRAVASLLRMYGLMRAGNEPLVPYAIRMLMGIHRANKKTLLQTLRLSKWTDPQTLFKLADEFKQFFCAIECKPHFVGVWDTVSSVGWIGNPLKLPYSSDNPDIEIGRHAVAIDERRAFFRSNLWHPSAHGGPKDCKQVWFPGVHSDIGGGYPENESGLSKNSLEWMLTEATAAGLLTDATAVNRILGRAGGGYVAPDATAPMHKSLTLPWWPAELIPKPHYNWSTKRERYRPNLFRRRTIPPGALVHASAYSRGDRYVARARLPKDAVKVS